MKLLVFLITVSAFAQTSPFPTSLDSNATLGVPADNVSSALTSPMLVGDTTAQVANATKIPQWSVITFGTEIAQVCLKSGNTLTFGTPTVCPSIAGRGLSGTTVAAHNTGVIGYLNVNGYYHQAVASGLIATQKKVNEIVSVKADYGAKGDDSTDDTASIQACIDFAAANRVTCYLPPAVYKITGAGLHMLTGFPSLYGLQGEGNGAPVLKYYGTGTCLAIGDGTNRLFGINLRNFSCAVATGVTAANGIYVRDTSGGQWDGLTVQGIGTGKFTTHFHFSDADLLWMSHINVTDDTWASGTTGFLFDDAVSFGNSNIHWDGGDLSNMDKMFSLRNCVNCKLTKWYIENSSHAFYIDNTSNTALMDNIVLDNGTVNTAGTGPSTHRILTLIGAAGRFLQLDQLHFTNNRFFLSGGVVSPISLAIDPAPAANSAANIYIDNNAFTGANTSLVVSNSLLASVWFGPNFAVDATGSGTKTPNLTGTATVNDLTPQDINRLPLFWTDTLGNNHSTSTAAGKVTIGGGTQINKYTVITSVQNFAAPTVPGCDTPLGLTLAGAVPNSSPIFYSPPVAVPANMVFFAWVTPTGQVAAQWCQFSGAPADPDGAGATYSVSVMQ